MKSDMVQIPLLQHYLRSSLVRSPQFFDNCANPSYRQPSRHHRKLFAYPRSWLASLHRLHPYASTRVCKVEATSLRDRCTHLSGNPTSTFPFATVQVPAHHVHRNTTILSYKLCDHR